MPNGVKRLFVLKLLIQQRFTHQFLAARELGIRDDELSRYIACRKEIPEKILVRLERLLGVDREAFTSDVAMKTATIKQIRR